MCTLYPLHLQLRYRIFRDSDLVSSGTGETVFIGAKSLLFWAEQPAERGLFAEMSIDWPALLENRVPLQLCIYGRIVSCCGRRVFIQIIFHELKLKAALSKGAGC